MRIALSVDSLTPQLTGIGRYCLELARGVPSDERITSVSYFRGSKWLKNPLSLLDGHEPQASHSRWLQQSAKWWNFGRFESAIVHAPNYFLPPWAERGVATIHDLSVFKFPETHPPERIKAFETNFASTIARANLILTDCDWVRREVIEFTGLCEERVRAVPLGVAADFHYRTPEELSPEIAGMGLAAGGYGLCVSTFEPRKRIGHLIEAWGRLPANLKERYPLALAGAAGWGNDALMQAIDAGQRAGWLKYLGFVPETKLPFLYAGARAFAYPSQYEGFGFPPLEAMASGVPTIVAEGTCLPEVTGGAAIVVDPEDADGLLAAIIGALEDDDQRTHLIAAGLDVTARYSWAECIRSTVDAYQTIL